MASADGDLAAAVLAWLARRTGRTDVAYRSGPERLHGGFWAEIWTFELEPAPLGFAGPLVLRLMPDVARARRESAVHAAVAQLGFATPRVRASGEAGEGLGRPFLLMDRVAGGSLAGGLSLRERLSALPRVPELLARALAELHALPPAALRDALAEHGLSEELLGVDALLDDLEATLGKLAEPELGASLAALRRLRPPAGDTVLCHGDLHGFNLILREGRVAAVIDWTNARVAEPEFDVAYSVLVLELLPLDVPRAFRGLLAQSGRYASRALAARYARRRPLDPAKLAWYDALHALAGLVRIAAADARLPDTQPLADSHPWKRMAQANRARLAAFVRRAAPA